MEHTPMINICRSSSGMKETGDIIIVDSAIEIKEEPLEDEREVTPMGLNLAVNNCVTTIEKETMDEIGDMDSESTVEACFSTDVKKEPSDTSSEAEIEADEIQQNGNMETEYTFTAKIKKEPIEKETGSGKKVNCCDVITNESSSKNGKKCTKEVGGDDMEQSANTLEKDDGGIAKRLRKIIPAQVIKYEDIYFAPKRQSGRRKKSKGGSSKMNRRRTRARKYSCETCGKGFYSQDVLKSHCLRHTGGKRFKCEICGKGYSWHTSYQNHMLAHTGETPYKCSYCDKILCNKLSLQGHVMRMHNKVKRTFACDRCDRFINKSELKYHKANHEEQRRFMCDMCGKSLSSKRHLASHRLIHTGEKPFTCTVCQKGFIRKYHLEDHMRQHTDGYSYQCEECGKQYSSSWCLQQHLLIHSDPRPYKCNLCEKDYKCRSALASHKDSHLGIKRHICEYCGKAFLSGPNMLKHKKRHLGVKNEVCALCSKAFITKAELRAHMRIHTRDPRIKKKAKLTDENAVDYKDTFPFEMPISFDTRNDRSCTLAADLMESSPPLNEFINENENYNTAFGYLSSEGDSTSDCDYPLSVQMPISFDTRNDRSCTLATDLKESSPPLTEFINENQNCNTAIVYLSTEGDSTSDL